MSRRKPTEAEQVATLEARLDRARELRQARFSPEFRLFRALDGIRR